MNSRTNGLPDCSKESSTNVKGEALSRRQSNLDTRRTFCVRWCWRLVGGMPYCLLCCGRVTVEIVGSSILGREIDAANVRYCPSLG